MDGCDSLWEERRGEERRHLIMHVRFLICKRRPNLMLPFK
jgi:hypothetical protein